MLLPLTLFAHLKQRIFSYCSNKFADDIHSSWFASYLTGRKQATEYCDVISGYLPTIYGVLIGSVLGPTCFHYVPL